MTEQEGYSPSFKRPSEILRIRRKRARSEGLGAADRVAGSSPGPSVPGVRPFSPGPLFGSPNLSGGGVKRRNPFASIENMHSKPKRRATLSPGGDADHPERKPVLQAGGDGLPAAVPLGELLTQAERAVQKKPPSLNDGDTEIDYLFSGEGRPSAAHPSGDEPAGSEATRPVEYPADWSLKTRLLITSPLIFSWAEHLKAQEEAQGLIQSCRATHCSLPAQIQEPRTCAELRCAFQQCLVYWQHPSLSWLPLFPRIGAERKLSGKSMPWVQDEALQQSLMSDWSLSVTSLYSLLRARLCPFFYLCTYQFTVLFRAAGMSGTGGITALLAPTTLGLREAMRAEGIEFTFPLLEEKKKTEYQEKHGHSEEPNTELKEQSEAEEDEDDDASFSWLKEMGVQDQINKPDSVSIKLRKEHREVQLDRRPQSVVLVKGADTFTLLNFFINYKGLVAASGVQTGLPPTLLAPVAFRSATLQTLKARSVNVKTQVQNGYQDMFSLEVSGPVMPHALHGLSQLLRIAQRGHFSVGLYTHEPTAVFNTSLGSPSMDTQQKLAQELEACGLALSTVQQLAEPARLGRSVLRQLDMDDYYYSWRT